MLDIRNVFSGHTFLPNHEVFLPKYQLDPAEMALSVVNANEATYRTVYFENVGPTPILFELDKNFSGLVITITVIIVIAPTLFLTRRNMNRVITRARRG